MDPSDPPRPCLFLEKLPVEIRRQVYAHLLQFSAPIKLRQVIPGSKDLPILRTNSQIHDEALSMLYELNTVVVTRNDFCHHTDAALKTPLLPTRVRHLLVAGFSVSIVCTLRGANNRCAVCQPAAPGFFAALRAMPRLVTATLDVSRHRAEYQALAKAHEGSRDGVAQAWQRAWERRAPGDPVVRPVVRLQWPVVEGLDVRVVF